MTAIAAGALLALYISGGWWIVSKIERRVRAWRIFGGRRAKQE